MMMSVAHIIMNVIWDQIVYLCPIHPSKTRAMNRHPEDYIDCDELGRWINAEFPPDSFTIYPRNSGYRTESREALYNVFAIQYYDMVISYHGEEMRLIADIGGCYVEDTNNQRISDIYPTANDLIKGFRFIDGKTLENVVDDSDFNIDVYC